MRPILRLLTPLLGAVLAATAAPPAQARIARIEITRTEPAFGGQRFGAVGAYQRLAGRAHGEDDPAHPGNATVQDLYLAARNARGLVEYFTDIELLAPADPARGNGVLLFEVVNRGNKVAPGAFHTTLHVLDFGPLYEAADSRGSAT